MSAFGKGFSSLLIILVVVLIIIIISLSYYTGVLPYLNIYTKELINQKSNQNNLTHYTNQNSQKSDWVTFTNKKYGYSIQHPTNFKSSSPIVNKYPEAGVSPIVILSSTNSFQTLSIYGDYGKIEERTLEEFVNEDLRRLSLAGNNSLKIIRDKEVNGKELIFVSNNDDDQLQLYLYILGNKGYVLRIDLGPVFKGSAQRYKSIFYEIVETLRIEN